MSVESWRDRIFTLADPDAARTACAASRFLI